MNSEYSLKLLQLDLERIDKYINLANIKASLVLPTNAILLGFLLDNQCAYLKFLKNSSLNWLATVVFVISLLCISLSFLLSILVVVAYLKSGAKPGEYISLLYFGSINKLELDIFQKKVGEINIESFTNDLSRQIHLLSKETERKFRCVNWSIVFLLISFLLTILIMILKTIF